MGVFPEMTDNMERLYMDVISSLGQLPVEIKLVLFGDDLNEDMWFVSLIANYIVLEFIKYSYDKNDTEYPLRHFINGKDDSERMKESRILNYVLKYKKREFDEIGDTLYQNHKFAQTDMSCINQKLKGYRLTEMSYFENSVIYDMELIKSLIEKRIVSSKKVSNERFIEMFSQYDEYVEKWKMNSENNDKAMVFYSLAFFTLEWHFPIETFYCVSCLMEEKGIDSFDIESISLLCSRVSIESELGGTIQTDSRMVKERDYFLSCILDHKENAILRDSMLSIVRGIIEVVAHYKVNVMANNGMKYIDWFCMESNEKDWASFFRYYNIFCVWKKKEWTHKRIQNMRKIIDLTFKQPL